MTTAIEASEASPSSGGEGGSQGREGDGEGMESWRQGGGRRGVRETDREVWGSNRWGSSATANVGRSWPRV